MTVCVAAIGQGRIIGASDRMLTAGDIQFEPQQSKIVQLTSSIAVMIAGDTTLQTEMLLGLLDDVANRMQFAPDVWLPVREVADLYYARYEESRNLRSSRAVLHPLGLTYDSYLTAPSELLSRIAVDLVNFAMPFFEAIVIGVDDSGSHIYTVRNSGVTCQDSIGFSAIGIGSQHSNSQLMFSGHVRTRSMPETLVSVFTSKKRAEVAPGVGSGTDMLSIGPDKGSYFAFGEHVLSELQGCYETLENEFDASRSRMNERVQGYVDEIIRAATAQDQSITGNDERNDPTADAALPTGE